MSKYNFTVSTDTSDPTIQTIKAALETKDDKGIAVIDKLTRDAMVIQDNLESNKTIHASVFLLVDISGSINPYRESLNKVVHDFIEAVVSKNSLAQESVDFCYMTFNNRVHIRKTLGYLSKKDLSEKWAVIDKETSGTTDIASALFTAWHMAEERKEYLKELNIPYRQPIIILVSDMKHNVHRNITINGKQEEFLNVVLDLLETKSSLDDPKLGIIEMILCDPKELERLDDNSLKKKLYNLKNAVKYTDLQEARNFANTLNHFLAMLLATVVDPGSVNALIADDEGEFIAPSIFISDSSGRIRPDSSKTVSADTTKKTGSYLKRWIKKAGD